jgi:hypothetical protein
LVNRYYGARSNLVHGSDPLTGAERERFLELVSNPSPILDIARRLLLGFLRLVDQPSDFRSMKDLRDRIDTLLVHSGEREGLRTSMRLRSVAAHASAGMGRGTLETQGGDGGDPRKT